MPKKPVPLNQRLSVWLVVLIVVGTLTVTRTPNETSASYSGKASALPVVTANTRNSDVPVYITALGGVTATYTVTVKTQINGQLMRVLFKEGQMVKTGDLLAEIDSRPYEAQLTQYEGQLVRDSALLANAKIDLKRYQTLWKQNSVAQQVLATQDSLVKQYIGDVETDQGLIQSTKVNITYCHIISPINGRVGLRLVDPGNFVQTSDTTGIAVINTINPITVIFTIPEDNVPQVIPQIYAGKSLLVQAYDRQQNKLLATGALLTIDNQIDPTTGTVKLRAQFDNQDNQLFPNQFVNMKLLVDNLHNAVLAPTAAIQHSSKGDFVYLLNDNNTVSVKPVTTGIVYSNETVIKTGLLPTQPVVVEGADKLSDGVKVSLADPPNNSTNKSFLKRLKNYVEHWLA